MVPYGITEGKPSKVSWNSNLVSSADALIIKLLEPHGCSGAEDKLDLPTMQLQFPIHTEMSGELTGMSRKLSSSSSGQAVMSLLFLLPSSNGCMHQTYTSNPLDCVLRLALNSTKRRWVPSWWTWVVSTSSPHVVWMACPYMSKGKMTLSRHSVAPVLGQDCLCSRSCATMACARRRSPGHWMMYLSEWVSVEMKG